MPLKDHNKIRTIPQEQAGGRTRVVPLTMNLRLSLTRPSFPIPQPWAKLPWRCIATSSSHRRTTRWGDLDSCAPTEPKTFLEHSTAREVSGNEMRSGHDETVYEKGAKTVSRTSHFQPGEPDPNLDRVRRRDGKSAPPLTGRPRVSGPKPRREQ